jgi:hypothetical protein
MPDMKTGGLRMPQLMLICSKGHVFGSGFAFGGDMQNLALMNNHSQCPVDGEIVPWPNGVFNAIDGVLKYVTESASPAQTAREVADELKNGQGKHLEAIKQLNPQLAIDTLSVSVNLLQVTLQLVAMLHSNPTVIIDKRTIINTYNNYCSEQVQKTGK